MIIVDKALAERESAGEPIGIALVGAGALARGLARQLLAGRPGLRLVGISNRNLERASSAVQEAGGRPVELREPLDLREQAPGSVAITSDVDLLLAGDGIDAVIEATGTVEFGARVALAAIESGRHVFVNAELEGTIGPILVERASSGGTIVSALDGDQPGTQLNLYRFVVGLGFRPLVCGNIKGLQDHTRTPETQRGFAEQWGISPLMATSFADGTKISFEQTVVANDVGFRVARRGMLGPEHRGPIEDAASKFDVEDLLEHGGIVDYALGATPSPGVFVLGAHDDPVQRAYMEFWKQGPGPLYTFYVPYHLAHMEAPTSVARAVLFGDATSTARAVVVEVVAIAKRDLAVGERLDGIGGFTAYGQCENSAVARAEGLLPIGLADGCSVTSPVAANRAITFDDVELPEDRVSDALWQEQTQRAS